MMTYVLLNVLFMALVLVLLRRYLPARSKSWYLTLIILLVMTAVFDNVIISLDIVAYTPAKLLGIYLYKAPIEDFFYALLAVVIVPALWRYYQPSTPTKDIK